LNPHLKDRIKIFNEAVGKDEEVEIYRRKHKRRF
jgi:hypothetical protein